MEGSVIIETLGIDTLECFTDDNEVIIDSGIDVMYLSPDQARTLANHLLTLANKAEHEE